MKVNCQKVIAVMLAATLFLCAGCKTQQNKSETSLKNQDSKAVGGIEDRAVDFSAIQVAAQAGAEAKITNGIAKVNFGGQWGQVVFAVPAQIDMQKVTEVTLNPTSGSDSSSLCLKLLTEEGLPSFSETLVNYSGLNLNVATSDGLKYVGVMNMIADARTVDFESITFTLDNSKITVTEIEDITPFKTAVTKALGSNAIAGGAIMYSEAGDKLLMDLVHKHFNAVTFGNELKPDAMLGSAAPGSNVVQVEIDVKQITVPTKLNMAGSNAEAMLNMLKEWNDANPKNKVKVRGHVLVWHSQTPEWFFHEDYDVKKPYTDPATMNLRQEWYIKSVLEYFVGKQSPYKDMFYGWDVLNEDVSDSTGTYRTDKENSSWGAVYKSNEFILNAFRCANKYAPKKLELYYNDYGETSPTKTKGIVQLLKDVKACPGARIDGFGMQGHYKTDSFNAQQFEDSARAYAEVVGKIMITELDFQTHTGYKGTAEEKAAELTKMAYCHKQIFDIYKKLNAEKGITCGGIVTWGIIEPNSWLHWHANVGGGADGKTKQCPLLFDGNYQVKPAYWAYVDPSRLEPNIQNIVIEQDQNQTLANANAKSVYAFSQNGIDVEFLPVWNAEGVKVLYKVYDKTAGDKDGVTVFVDAKGSLKDGAAVAKASASRKNSAGDKNSYTGEIVIPCSVNVAQTIGFDLCVSNNGEKISFNDFNNSQDKGSKYFASAILKPSTLSIAKGTVKIDAAEDEAWKNAEETKLQINLGADAEASVKCLYDSDNLYVYFKVLDPKLDDKNANAWEQDSVEVFIDENNHKTSAYEADDKQYRINYKNVQSFNGQKCIAENIKSAAKTVSGGYVVEAAFKWTDVKPSEGASIGIEFQINDAENGIRKGTLSWFDQTGQGYASPAVYGTAVLK